MNRALYLWWLCAGSWTVLALTNLCGCLPDSGILNGAAILAPEMTETTVTGTLTEGEPSAVNVSASVAEVGRTITGVVVDLSQIGGLTRQGLTQSHTSHWTFTGTLTPAVAGVRTVTFTAYDDAGAKSTATASIQVISTSSPLPPASHGSNGIGTKIPLGQSASLSSSDIGKVYVPSRYGGQLTLSGANLQLIYTDGSDLQEDIVSQLSHGGLASSAVAQGNPCSYTVPQGKPGWYYVRLKQKTSGTVSSSFVETGQASYRPWNGWWWAWNPTGGPTLYDAGGPLDKYDQIYKTDAQGWAADNETGGSWWWGHCWGWAIASILLPEPLPATRNGMAFTLDDMKGLYSNVADDNPYVDQGLSLSDIPAGPPTGRVGEDVDAYCDEVYRILRTCIREDNVPILSDMRVSDSTSADRAGEVWNQAIYRYAASFSEAPGGDESLAQIDMQVWANYDLSPPPTNNTKDRSEQYVYQLEFDQQGMVIPNSPRQNWISTSHFAPRDLHRVTGSPWAPKNPYLTKAHIDGLYAR